MIVLRNPEGLDGPEEVDGLADGGHVALPPGAAGRREEEPGPPRAARRVAAQLPAGGALRRRRPLVPELAALAAERRRRMSANPHANGGLLLRELALPDFREYAVDVQAPGDRRPARRRGSWARSCATSSRATRQLPDLRAGRDRLEPPRRGVRGDRRACGWPTIEPADEHLAPDGRVMEVLSEHLCQGWLEGYLLTGRHGLFNCYEAFIHIIDSMFNQHAKWLKVTREIPWRRPIASLNYLLTLARLAPGPQRLLPPGPGLHRPRREQEGRGHPRLPAAGREHAALGRRPLPAQPELRQRHRRRQAARARLPPDGRRGPALHARARHLGLGVERRGRGARRRARLRGRRADARDAGGGGDPPRAPARSARCASSTSST